MSPEEEHDELSIQMFRMAIIEALGKFRPTLPSVLDALLSAYYDLVMACIATAPETGEDIRAVSSKAAAALAEALADQANQPPHLQGGLEA